MAKKSKAVVWHKKQGKFIPSKVLNAPEGGTCCRPSSAGNPAPGAPEEKRQAFRLQLAEKIKQAARRSSRHDA